MFRISNKFTKTDPTRFHLLYLLLGNLMGEFIYLPPLFHHFGFFYHQWTNLIGNNFISWRGKYWAVPCKDNVFFGMILRGREFYLISLQKLQQLKPGNDLRSPAKIVEKRLRNKISGKEKEKVSSVKKAMATWNVLVAIYSTFTLKSPLFPFI